MRSRIPTALGACLLASTLALWARPESGWMGAGGVVHGQAAAVAAPATRETALDRYVKTPDPAFRFSVVATRPGEGHTAYLLEMVSQRWLSTTEVDKPEWRHWLTIIKPDAVAHSTALLLVGGGDSKRKAPDKTDAGLLDIAMTTQSVVAELPDGPEPAAGVRRRRRPRAVRGRDHRLYLGQVPAHRRRALAGAPADDQGGGAGHGRGHRLLRAARRRAPRSRRQFRRRRRVEARLDHVDDGGGRRRVVAHRADRDRRAQRRAVLRPPLPRLRLLRAVGEGLRGGRHHGLDGDAAVPRPDARSRSPTNTASG